MKKILLITLSLIIVVASFSTVSLIADNVNHGDGSAVSQTDNEIGVFSRVIRGFQGLFGTSDSSSGSLSELGADRSAEEASEVLALNVGEIVQIDRARSWDPRPVREIFYPDNYTFPYISSYEKHGNRHNVVTSFDENAVNHPIDLAEMGAFNIAVFGSCGDPSLGDINNAIPRASLCVDDILASPNYGRNARGNVTFEHNGIPYHLGPIGRTAEGHPIPNAIVTAINHDCPEPRWNNTMNVWVCGCGGAGMYDGIVLTFNTPFYADYIGLIVAGRNDTEYNYAPEFQIVYAEPAGSSPAGTPAWVQSGCCGTTVNGYFCAADGRPNRPWHVTPVFFPAWTRMREPDSVVGLPFSHAHFQGEGGLFYPMYNTPNRRYANERRAEFFEHVNGSWEWTERSDAAKHAFESSFFLRYGELDICAGKRVSQIILPGWDQMEFWFDNVIIAMTAVNYRT